MNGDEFLDKMEHVHPAYVEAAKNQTEKKKAPWKKWIAMAACLCILITIGTRWFPFATNGTGSDSMKSESMVENGSVPSESTESMGSDVNATDISEYGGVTIPPMKVYLADNDEAEVDMAAFFIYQNQVYTYYEWVTDNDDVVGEYLGTATGLIDEWTPEDGYVELAGSIRGDFYSVKGYDPSFMLCMKHGDGDISIFMCNTGITLKYGSDLYEDRLHLTGNYDEIYCETRESWNYSKQESFVLNTSEESISAFIDALNKAEFLPWNIIPSREGHTHSSIYDTEQYHLYFKMKDGTTVHLRLYEHGYVRFQGVLGACVQIPEETYQNLITYFREVNPYEK